MVKELLYEETFLKYKNVRRAYLFLFSAVMLLFVLIVVAVFYSPSNMMPYLEPSQELITTKEFMGLITLLLGIWFFVILAIKKIGDYRLVINDKGVFFWFQYSF